MKKFCMIVILLLVFTGFTQAGQQSINVNFRYLDASNGWNYHEVVLKNPNLVYAAGYYPVDFTANEIVRPENAGSYPLKEEFGADTSAVLTVNRDFTYWTWYNNVDSWNDDGDPETPDVDNGLTDYQRNNLRVGAGIIGHNGGSEKKSLATISKVPYGAYTAVVFLCVDADGRDSEITVGDTTYYYTTENGYTWEARQATFADGDPNWLLATNTTPGNYSQTANVAVFPGLDDPTFEIIFDCLGNSGISGIQLVADELAEEVATLVAPATGSIGIPLTTLLEWDNPTDFNATGFDVYIGEADDPNWLLAPPVISDEKVYSYAPTLEYNKKYVWRVDSYGAGGALHIGNLWYFNAEGDPVILTQPGSTAAPVGGSAQFSVEAELAETYTWYSTPDATVDTPGDDVEVQTGTSNTLILENLVAEDFVFYYCILENTIPGSSPVPTDVVELILGKLEAYWAFDNDPNDYVGGWHGTPLGTHTYDTGLVGQAIHTDSTVEILGSETYFNFYPTGLTVSMWAKADTPQVGDGGYYVMAAKDSWWASNGWVVADKNVYSTTGPVCKVAPVTVDSSSSLGNDNPDFGTNWHLVTLTYDAGIQAATLYIDGAFISTTSGLPNPSLNTGIVTIGGNAGGGMEFHGLLDEVKIYSYPQQAIEVASAYAEQAGAICYEPITGDLNGDCKVDIDDAAGIANTWLGTTLPDAVTPTVDSRVISWQFDETEGLVAHDSSGNGIDGTLGAGFVADPNWQPNAGRTGLPGDGALYCDGNPDMSVIATVADANSFPNGAENIFLGTSSWTINLWIKFDGLADMVNIGGFGDCEWDAETVGQTDRYFAAFGDYSGYEFETGDDGFWPSDTLADGTWKMLTVTYDGTTQEGACYLNGEFKSSKTVVLADTEEQAFKINSFGAIIWEEYGNPRTWARAWYDDFSVWDQAFLPRHVKGMYEGTFTSCDGAILGDMDGDCTVNLDDFAILAADWLECNILPTDLCN